MRQINNEYAALVLIEILYEREFINKATYDSIQSNHKRFEKIGRIMYNEHINKNRNAVWH